MDRRDILKLLGSTIVVPSFWVQSKRNNLPTRGYFEIPLKLLRGQPLRDINNQYTETLKEDIKEKGILNPITVAYQEGSYNVINGWLRIKACRELSIIKIPAIIINVESISYTRIK